MSTCLFCGEPVYYGEKHNCPNKPALLKVDLFKIYCKLYYWWEKWKKK